VAVVAGHSGHLNLNVFTRFANRSRCYIEVPAVDGVIFASGARDAADYSAAGFAEEPNRAVDSPDSNSGSDNQDLKKPIMLVVGTSDPRVPVSALRQAIAHLKSKGTPVWFLSAADEGYEFQKKANRDYCFYAMVLFLEQFLLK